MWHTVGCVPAVMPRAKPSLTYINSYYADRENMESAESCTSVPWHSDFIFFLHVSHLGSAIKQSQYRIVMKVTSLKVRTLHIFTGYEELFCLHVNAHFTPAKRCLIYRPWKWMWKTSGYILLASTTTTLIIERHYDTFMKHPLNEQNTNLEKCDIFGHCARSDLPPLLIHTQSTRSLLW